jgi:hypothetical protein
MKRIVVILMAMLCPASYLIAQSATNVEKGKKSGFFNKFTYADIAVTNTHTAMPFGAFYQLFTGELHPGVEIGTEITWNHTRRYDWIQTFKVGYSFQEYIQHMINIYTEGGMRYRLPWKMDVSGKLGVGYIFAIEDSKVFVLNNDGKYVERLEAGRSNLMASLGFDLRKQIDRYGTAVYIGYQQKVQFGFINSYVPMLPLNMGSVGVSIPLHKH